MTLIVEREKCCGCMACVSACKHQSIRMTTDSDGFRYPVIRPDTCVDCGRCRQVCPALHPCSPEPPSATYAAWHSSDEIRMASSSGGAFSALAEWILERQGVVFGARFDAEWQVVHTYATTLGELAAFRGSKYVQSYIGTSYVQARDFLEQGRMVLFSGTACQIHGLRLFLRKDYPLLYTVDVVCHGVPSPAVWQKFLRETVPAGDSVCGLSFRDKRWGWHHYGVALQLGSGREIYTPGRSDAYMRGFLNDLFLRESCYTCPSKGGKADLTLADFWGVEREYPELDDDRGVSLVLVRTPKGESWFRQIALEKQEIAYAAALRHNPSVERPVDRPGYRDKFMRYSPYCSYRTLVAYLLTPHKKLSYKIRLAFWFAKAKEKYARINRNITFKI